jgi:hypothetical protein
MYRYLRRAHKVSRYSAPSPAQCRTDPHHDRRDAQGLLAAADLASAVTDLDVVIRLLMNISLGHMRAEIIKICLSWAADRVSAAVYGVDIGSYLRQASPTCGPMDDDDGHMDDAADSSVGSTSHRHIAIPRCLWKAPYRSASGRRCTGRGVLSFPRSSALQTLFFSK